MLDIIGNHSLSDCRRALTPEGTLVLVGGPDKGRWLGPLTGMLKPVVLSRFVRQNLVMFGAKRNKEDLTIMHQLMEAGKVTPVIDKRYRLSEVPEAIRYLEEGHARGKVVITVDYNNKT
jgi:NADPH:quinone reductase-like Zn-dependent oxidoreductase